MRSENQVFCPDDDEAGAVTRGYATISCSNARIKPIWFLRGCRSPTVRTNGAEMPESRLNEARKLPRGPLGETVGDTAIGTTSIFCFVEPVGTHDRTPRELAGRDHFHRLTDGSLDGHSELQCAGQRKVFRMLDEADVMHADDDRNGAGHRGSVLDVDQVRTVVAQLPRQSLTRAV